jgi:hypothetical protein
MSNPAYLQPTPTCQVDAACQEHATVIHVAVDPTGPPTPAAHLSLLSCAAHAAAGRGEIGRHSSAIVFTYRLAEPEPVDPPEVILMLIDSDLETDEQSYRADDLVGACPHAGCDQVNYFIEDDRSERENDVEIDGQWITVRQGDGEYHTVGWRCSACRQPVEFPDADEARPEWT